MGACMRMPLVGSVTWLGSASRLPVASENMTAVAMQMVPREREKEGVQMPNVQGKLRYLSLRLQSGMPRYRTQAGMQGEARSSARRMPQSEGPAGALPRGGKRKEHLRHPPARA